jgi:hypothetical protein|tara:strand:+ start:37 stop:267 length:231 start_codon:yes stop_codon:yes gene_type:complete
MLWSVKGNGITAYLKVGFNILRRFKMDSEVDSDDNYDCFMWIASAKTLEGAKKLAAKQEFETEIREFKIQQVEKDF